MERVSEASAEKRSAAERCGASERSERCERSNVASDRVARQKRDCLSKTIIDSMAIVLSLSASNNISTDNH